MTPMIFHSISTFSFGEGNEDAEASRELQNFDLYTVSLPVRASCRSLQTFY